MRSRMRQEEEVPVPVRSCRASSPCPTRGPRVVRLCRRPMARAAGTQVLLAPVPDMHLQGASWRSVTTALLLELHVEAPGRVL